MTIDFSEGLERSEHELDSFERTIEMELPDDYRRFLAANDGARPADNRFAFRSDVQLLGKSLHTNPANRGPKRVDR